MWRSFERTLMRLDPNAVEESLLPVVTWLENWLTTQGIFLDNEGQSKPFSIVSTDRVGAWDIMFRYRLHTVFRLALEGYRKYGYDAAILALKRTPLVVCVLMDSRHQAVATYALASASGWVGTKISLRKNQRLHAVLTTCHPGRPFPFLLKQLPIPVTLSWGVIKKEATATPLSATTGKKRKHILARLVSGATNQLEKELMTEQEQLQHMGKGLGPIDGDFSLRAQVRVDFEVIRRKAGLSRREALAITARLSGRTEAQVAKELKVKPGTASALIHRAKKKLRAAAGFL
jgi:hypothetical protein